jgi:FkbM family methyltransferase
MKKIFLDCGYHLGEGLNEFANMLGINDEWEVYAFEPNPHCDIKNKVSQHPFKVKAFDKAVWIENGIITFNCENQNATNSPKINSTSVLDGWGSVINDVGSSHTYETQTQVGCFDFSELVKSLEGNEIYCKMDIEGAEFKTLRKMLKDNTISLIKEIWVEWHDVDLQNESPESQNSLSKEISKFTKINKWK